MDGTVNMKGSLRARCSCLTGSSRAASEDELPVGWGDVVAVVVDVVQDGWAVFFDGDCDGVLGVPECVVEQVAYDLDEVIRIGADLSGGDSTRVDGGGGPCRRSSAAWGGSRRRYRLRPL
jgi:hypothetical protein